MSNIDRIVDDWPNSGIAMWRGSNMRELMTALVSQLDVIESDSSDIYDASKIDSASGNHLERLGGMVGVRRRVGESDDLLRERIRLRYALNSMTATMDEIAQFILILTGSNISSVDFDTDFPNFPATLIITADIGIFTDGPLSESDLIEFAEATVPAGHRVQIRERGTFEVIDESADEYGDHDPDKGVTAETASDFRDTYNVTDAETGGTVSTILN